MLVAYAIENLFKALLIIQSKEKLNQELMLSYELPKELKGHDLSVLAQKAKFDISHLEFNLLSRPCRNSIGKDVTQFLLKPKT
jgi:hypothetical protein